MSTSSSPQTPFPSALRRVFVGASGVRAGWRLLAWLAIFTLLTEGRNAAVRAVGGLDEISRYVLNQATRFLFCLAVSAGFARLEGRSLAAYGLPGREAFGRRFWQGMLVGFAALSALLGAMAVFGVFRLGPIALSARAAAGYGALYLGICVVIALSEEFFYRGYPQFTLGAGIGFWPAALLLSAYFGYTHLGRATETPLGAINAGLGGLVFCLLLKRSGSLWLPIGFHTSFNWAQIYFYGVPASGASVPGHLFEARFTGPAALSGGSVGPEGSWLCTLLLLAVAAAFARRPRSA